MKAAQQPPRGAAVRWAINADGEGGLSLLLQALPASAASLNSRPTFKRDICPGVTLINLLLSVDIDYNSRLIGPKPRLFSTAPETTAKILGSSRSSIHNTGKGKSFIQLTAIKKTIQNKSDFLQNLLKKTTFRHRIAAEKNPGQGAHHAGHCHCVRDQPEEHRGGIPVRGSPGLRASFVRGGHDTTSQGPTQQEEEGGQHGQ